MNTYKVSVLREVKKVPTLVELTKVTADDYFYDDEALVFYNVDKGWWRTTVTDVACFPVVSFGDSWVVETA